MIERLVKELLEDLLAADRVGNLGMELDAIKRTRAVLHRRHRRPGRSGSRGKPGRGLGDAIAVAHPHFELGGKVTQQMRTGDHFDFSAAVLGSTCRGNSSSRDIGQKLMAVANAEDRNPGVDYLGVHPVGLGRIDGSGTTRENDPGWPPSFDLGRGDRAGDDLRVDVSFPNPPGYQLGVLSPKVDYEDYVLFTYCALRGA
jgi:hypothetical protein